MIGGLVLPQYPNCESRLFESQPDRRSVLGRRPLYQDPYSLRWGRRPFKKGNTMTKGHKAGWILILIAVLYFGWQYTRVLF